MRDERGKQWGLGETVVECARRRAIRSEVGAVADTHIVPQTADLSFPLLEHQYVSQVGPLALATTALPPSSVNQAKEAVCRLVGVASAR